MIEHPAWSAAELHQMRVMRERLIRGRGNVRLSAPPNRAEQFAIDEWYREHPRKPVKPEKVRRPGEGYIHWPGGIASKIYVAVVFGGGLLVIVGVLLGGGDFPAATPEQRRPWFQRYVEPMLPSDVQADLADRRWRKAIADLSPEQKALIEQKRAYPVSTGDPDRPVELVAVDEDLAREVREGRVILIPQVAAKAAASPTQ